MTQAQGAPLLLKNGNLDAACLPPTIRPDLSIFVHRAEAGAVLNGQKKKKSVPA